MRQHNRSIDRCNLSSRSPMLHSAKGDDPTAMGFLSELLPSSCLEEAGRRPQCGAACGRDMR